MNRRSGLRRASSWTCTEAVAQTAHSGVSILLVEQNAEAALSVAHRGYVIAHGQVTASGSADELRRSDAVQDAFLGKRRVVQGTP